MVHRAIKEEITRFIQHMKNGASIEQILEGVNIAPDCGRRIVDIMVKQGDLLYNEGSKKYTLY